MTEECPVTKLCLRIIEVGVDTALKEFSKNKTEKTLRFKDWVVTIKTKAKEGDDSRVW